MTSTSSSGLDKETIFAAAMIANRQMMNRKPILLGSNSDGTMNVQLPSGTVIVVEAEATDFPGYTTKTKTFKKNKRTKKSSQGKYNQHSGRLRDNLSFSSKGDETVGKSSATTSNSAVIHSKPNQPTTSNATVEQIERALPNAASCVFHVFDRRVNLEAYNADTVTNYALLRAWVQDDPYRYLGPIAEDLVLPTTTTTMRSTTTVLDQTAATRTDSGIKEVSVSHETVANVDILSELRMGRDDASLSVDTLRKSWVQQARGVKRRTLRDIRIRDAQILRSLNARGVKLN